MEVLKADQARAERQREERRRSANLETIVEEGTSMREVLETRDSERRRRYSTAGTGYIVSDTSLIKVRF